MSSRQSAELQLAAGVLTKSPLARNRRWRRVTQPEVPKLGVTSDVRGWKCYVGRPDYCLSIRCGSKSGCFVPTHDRASYQMYLYTCILTQMAALRLTRACPIAVKKLLHESSRRRPAGLPALPDPRRDAPAASSWWTMDDYFCMRGVITTSAERYPRISMSAFAGVSRGSPKAPPQGESRRRLPQR